MPSKLLTSVLLLVAAATGQVPFKQTPHGPAPADGFKFLYTVPLADRQYMNGTVEGFVSELPGFFQRAATAGGMTGRDYSKEISFIIDAVKTCSQITPQMAASVFEPNGKKAWSKPDGIEALEKLGPQYEVCKVKNGADISSRVEGASPRRGVALNIEPYGTYKLGNGLSQWLEGKGFFAQVFFSGMPHDGDDLIKRGGRLQPSYDYTIVYALFRKP